MSIDSQSEEGQIIRQLIPLSTIPTDQFEELCNKISVEVAESNTFLFKRKDTKNDLVYLIKGSISLQSDNLIVENISAGSNSAKFAIAHQIPRKIDARTQSAVRFLRLDSSILNTLSSTSHEQEENSYMSIDEPEDEDDTDNDGDWMTTLLKSPIFRALPPANLQQIIMSLEEIEFLKGEIVINQGEPGDYYYLIKSGHCLISRKASTNAKEIKLSQLHPQDTFGEDSLLSGEPRNVSISALTNTTLIRLSKEKFISLIKEPSLEFIDHSELAVKLTNDAVLIDVRSAEDYKKYHLPNSINIPFFSLRMQLKSIDKKKEVIVVCENGKSSEAATFLLLRNKIHAQILKGGMQSVPSESVESVAAFDIDDGVETLTADSSTLKPEEGSELLPSDTVEFGTDNALRLENKKLEQRIEELVLEKQELEKKYRKLYKQTEKLKIVLDSFRS